MAAALASIAVTAALVGVAGALAYALHRLMRPRELLARSATALRELEPRGGRHRFRVRLFEVLAIACCGTTTLGTLFLVAEAENGGAFAAIGAGGALVALWWVWRRGALRDLEAEPPPAEVPDKDAGPVGHAR